LKYKYGSDLFSLPFELLQFAEKERKVNHLRVFLWLKFEFGSAFDEIAPLTTISDDLCLHPKTARKCLNWLYSANWIGLSRKTNKSYVRGFDGLRIMYNWDKRTSYRIQRHQMNELKGFIYAALFNEIIKRSSIKGRTLKDGGACQLPLLDSKQCSASFYAQRYSISERTAFKHKRIAIQSGFMMATHVFKSVGVNVKEYEMKQFRKYGGYGMIIRKNKGYAIQLPDKLETTIEISKRKRFSKL
jgi:hypothetical protein